MRAAFTTPGRVVRVLAPLVLAMSSASVRRHDVERGHSATRSRPRALRRHRNRGCDHQTASSRHVWTAAEPTLMSRELGLSRWRTCAPTAIPTPLRHPPLASPWMPRASRSGRGAGPSRNARRHDRATMSMRSPPSSSRSSSRSAQPDLGRNRITPRGVMQSSSGCHPQSGETQGDNGSSRDETASTAVCSAAGAAPLPKRHGES